MVLVIMLIANIFLMRKSYANKEENILDEVEIKELNYDKTFAIMLGDKEGIYSESKENIWPNRGYNYNSNSSSNRYSRKKYNNNKICKIRFTSICSKTLETKYRC